MNHSPVTSSRATMRGFTLVELMVGIAIGLVLMAGLGLMFANTSQSGSELNKSIRQIENGRYAVQLLEDDMAHAGFYGELPLDGINYGPKPSDLQDLCGATGHQGWDAATSRAPLPILGLSKDDSANCLANRLAGTPAFVIHHIGNDAAPIAPASATTGMAYVQTSRCSKDVDPGNPSLAAFAVAATAPASFPFRSLDCTTPSPVRPYIARIYYIASCSECSGSGADTTPTLKMAELRGNSMTVIPLVEGIEQMVLEYGVDTAGTGNASSFGIASSTTDWGNIVAVRVHLLSRTTEPSPGFTDSKTYVLGGSTVTIPEADKQFKRRVYTTTVRLTNVAGPREIPVTTPPASS